MDVDTKAGTEVERWDEQRPVLDDLVGRPNNTTTILSGINITVLKMKG
jgi:hypothetical protein